MVSIFVVVSFDEELSSVLDDVFGAGALLDNWDMIWKGGMEFLGIEWIFALYSDILMPAIFLWKKVTENIIREGGKEGMEW